MRLFSWLAARWQMEGAMIRRRERVEMVVKLLMAYEAVRGEEMELACRLIQEAIAALTDGGLKV